MLLPTATLRAGNITVTKGTYKDLKVLTGEKAVADHSTTGAATITVADKKTAKVGDITVDAGAFTKSGSGSLTAGNATVNAANGLAFPKVRSPLRISQRVQVVLPQLVTRARSKSRAHDYRRKAES